MEFLKKFNHDNIFFRDLLVGLLSALNEKVTYIQVGGDGKQTEIFIPFLASMTGDEPFLQDNFIKYTDCEGNPVSAEGNYDVIPRGVVEVGSPTIVTTSATNKYVRATYNKEIPNADGGEEIRAYSSYLAPIPINQPYTVRIKVDTEKEVFQVQARVIEVLFKNFIFYFEYNGFRIPAQASLSDDLGQRQKLFNYSYGTSKNDVTLTFTMNVETYLPQLDLSTERFRGNLMQGGIRVNTSIGNTITKDDGTHIIEGIKATNTQYTVNYGPGPGSSDITLT
jgi:hypothetical protein